MYTFCLTITLLALFLTVFNSQPSERHTGGKSNLKKSFGSWHSFHHYWSSSRLPSNTQKTTTAPTVLPQQPNLEPVETTTRQNQVAVV